jgi:hypothetical protein
MAITMLSLCLGLTGTVWVQLPVADFTLAWNHSVEKIRWEEDYRVTGQGLVLEQARVRGSGAGMEVPDGAQMKDGSWHYRRELPPLQSLNLGRTPEAGDYELCFEGACRFMSEWVGPPDSNKAAIELWVCPQT